MVYPNVPRVIGVLISARMTTLHELDSVYSLNDAYDLWEILRVDNYNQQLLNKGH